MTIRQGIDNIVEIEIHNREAEGILVKMFGQNYRGRLQYNYRNQYRQDNYRRDYRRDNYTAQR